MTPLEILARELYHAHPIIYRSWDLADESVRCVYRGQAQAVVDALTTGGFQILASGVAA